MSRRIAKEFIDKIYAPDLEYDQDYADKLVDDLEALINKARIEELKQIEPPEQYEEYAKLTGRDSCTICGFDAVKFRRFIEDRIKTLKSKQKGKG